MKHLFIAILMMLFLAATGLQAQEKISEFDLTVIEKENFEPVIPRPEQEKIAAEKLKKLEAKTGKKPNILIFLVDDLGWGF